jgi:trehalose-phosphatase
MVALARHRLLMLDYDGTLAPFAIERHEAGPMPRALDLIRRIAARRGTWVAIVSGRPLAELRRLVGLLPARYVGEHGWEWLESDGTVVRGALDPPTAAVIERAEQVARDAGWGALIERKRSAVVLHTRTLSTTEARSVEAACAATWSALAIPGRVAVDRMDGGVELRARARNKGTAALSLLAQSPPGTLGVFVGDDVTDEDAFDALRGRGFGIRVGDWSGPSLAMGRVPSCQAVTGFLEDWLRVVGAAPGAAT